MTGIIIIIILAIVEGITEFLPISSTGHIILVNHFLRNTYYSEAFMDIFLVIVQLGAILAVLLCFWNDISPFTRGKQVFRARFNLYIKLGVALIPAVVLGLLFEDMISAFFMDNIYVVASTLILYGLIFIFIEKRLKSNSNANTMDLDNISYIQAFAIGAFQCLAFVPGTSRSGATIIGGLLLGLTRSVSAEFSFLLAIPTMLGATVLKLYKKASLLTMSDIMPMTVGVVVSFIVAYVVVRWFLSYIRKRDFVAFGIYRVLLGILVIILVVYMG